MSSEPFIEQTEEESPSFSDVLSKYAKGAVGKVRGPMPARVTKYVAKGSKAGSASVLPSFTQRYSNGDEVVLPVIPNVPVMQMSGGGMFFSVPLKKNDDVFLFFAERSLDEWKAEGRRTITPQRKGRFSEADAIAFPGPKPFKRALLNLDPSKLVLGENSPAGLRITIGSGKVTIGTEAVDFLGQVDAFLDAVITFATATSGASVEPTLGPAATTLNTQAVAVKTALATIKGV